MINIAMTGETPRNHKLKGCEGTSFDRHNPFQRTPRGIEHAHGGFEATSDDRQYATRETDIVRINNAHEETSHTFATTYGITEGYVDRH